MAPPDQTNTHLTTRSVEIRFVISALILLILALGFNALLSLNSLEKLYVESIASQYSAIGRDLQRNLEKALRFGKSLEKFVGMDKILHETKRNLMLEYSAEAEAMPTVQPVSADEISIAIVRPDGEVLYRTDEGPELPDNLGLSAEAEEGAAAIPTYLKYPAMYITPLPIRDMKGKWLATAVIAFDDEQVTSLLNAVRDDHIRLILLLLAGSSLALILLLRLVTPNRRQVEAGKTKFSKFKIFLVLFLVIGSAQVIFAVINTSEFGRYYLQMNKQKVRTLATLLKEDVEFLFSKGIRIEKLVKMDAMLGEIIAELPELEAMTIKNADGLPLYMATKQDVSDFQQATPEELAEAYEQLPVFDPDYAVRVDLVQHDEALGFAFQQGFIEAHIAKEVILGKLFQIGLDAVTVLIISMLFFVEMTILIFLYIERQLTISPQRQAIQYGAIRPAAFLFIFGAHIAISFLPLFMESLYAPMLGLSKEMVLGLPISIKVLFTGISIMLSGIWLDRRGWHEPFLSGLALTGLGSVYAGVAPDALHFIISQGLTGIGFGFSLMASQGFVIQYTNDSNRAQGLSRFWAGVYAGSICGSAIGAMLAERFGFRLVFFFGASMMAGVIAYTLIFMHNAIHKPEKPVAAAAASEGNVELGQSLRFIFNRNILGLIILSTIPNAIAVIGFLNYYVPIYLNGIGASQSNIGRMFMLQGLCVIYIAPLLSRFIDAARDKRRYIFGADIIGGLAFLAFYFVGAYMFGGILATAFAVLLLGLSTSFDDSRSSYALGLPVTQQLGAGKAMGLLSSAERVGQVIGPMLFSSLILLMGMKGTLYFGIACIVAAFLFLLLTQNIKYAQ